MFVWGWKIVPVMYICQSRTESNTKRLVLGFQVFYSVLLRTTLRSSAPLSKQSSTTVSVWANSAAVRRRLTSSSRRRLRSASTAEVLVPATQRSTIDDRHFAVAGPRSWNNLPVDLRLSRTFNTFKIQNTLEVASVQLILSFGLTVSLTIFVLSPWSRLCCIRLFKFVIIRLHYITFSEQHYGYV